MCQILVVSETSLLFLLTIGKANCVKCCLNVVSARLCLEMVYCQNVGNLVCSLDHLSYLWDHDYPESAVCSRLILVSGSVLDLVISLDWSRVLINGLHWIFATKLWIKRLLLGWPAPWYISLLECFQCLLEGVLDL